MKMAKYTELLVAQRYAKAVGKDLVLIQRGHVPSFYPNNEEDIAALKKKVKTHADACFSFGVEFATASVTTAMLSDLTTKCAELFGALDILESLQESLESETPPSAEESIEKIKTAIHIIKTKYPYQAILDMSQNNTNEES